MLSELNQLCLTFLLETIECDSAIIGPIENYSMVKFLQRFNLDIGYEWKLLHRGSIDGFDRDSIITKFDNLWITCSSTLAFLKFIYIESK